MTGQSHPSLKVKIELMSRQAQRIYHWVYARIGEMFFMMEVVYAQHSQLHDAITEKQEAISQKLDQLDQLLQNRASELQDQIQDDKQSFDSGSSRMITLNCTTPQSQCCAPLLIHFDQLVLLYEQLWLLGLLTRKEAMSAINQWTLTVSETLYECQRLFQELQKQAKQRKKKA